MLKTTDNNCGRFRIDDSAQVTALRKIAGVKISDLNLEDHANLLIFPNNLNIYGDEIAGDSIFTLAEDGKLTTGNIMGFVGVDGVELAIRSRFAQDEKQDYFLHYMLQKVLAINLFNLPHSQERQDVFDFLLYLFPHYLKDAMRQGIFREYRTYKYNDANVRGIIDVSRHLHRNIPFAGRVAYRTREHSGDNRITQLVRHTIEHIRRHPFGAGILSSDADTAECVMQMTLATPSYCQQERRAVIARNFKPLVHPYYSAYAPLQRICLQILRYEMLKYGEQKDKIHGILFDGAWLWEEYLHTLFKPLGFEHPQNRTGKGRKYFLANEKKHWHFYPDFYKGSSVLDAKYKHEENNADKHQIIAYMYALCAKHGGFVFPGGGDTEKVGMLNGYGGEIVKYRLPIPLQCASFHAFSQSIGKNENTLKKLLGKP